jgi:S-adenosylmethionine-diacylglycerol 3-amino-3-carboxypropyl transferase
MTSETPALQADTAALLGRAVHRSTAASREGLRERLFTMVFSRLVYAQIWEDPVVDLEALDIRNGSRVVTIASGGCNVLSYLTANPERIHAVDLNAAHVALNRLKITAAQRLPNHAALVRFFGCADDPENVSNFDRFVAPHLDPTAHRYWTTRDLLGRRRIDVFKRGFYRTGLLGRFIGAAHAVARLYGVDPREVLRTTSRAEQQAVFERGLAPLFDRRLVKALLDSPMSLYGLGIPPAQYQELAAGSIRMADVVRERLRKLTCDFDLDQNYFAWQAFNRGYAADRGGPLPPYLDVQNFDAISQRAGRVGVHQISLTEFLSQQPASSLDRYVLLDAQDWMPPRDLTHLWRAITRTAKPDARVIFRTAGSASILTGRVSPEILKHWTYHERRSRELHARDRSAIYGGFHLYTKVD